jgi:hypothetical protein
MLVLTRNASRLERWLFNNFEDGDDISNFLSYRQLKRWQRIAIMIFSIIVFVPGCLYILTKRLVVALFARNK